MIGLGLVLALRLAAAEPAGAPAGAEQPELALPAAVPAEEPEPASQEVVELGPALEEEPAPGGAGPADDAPREEDEQRPAARAGSAERRRWRAEERRARREGGVCGRRGPPIPGFSVEGHRFTPQWLDRTLHGVIANRCQSKTYRDVLSLDGGTVGISHFAHGSLLTLYQYMRAARYFGVHARHVPDRPYRFAWWREGMRRFLRSPEAPRIQQRAWRAYISPALAQALRHGWRTERQLAIAASVANSLGAWGFQQLAQQNGWDAERTMRSYARMSDHKERRRQRLDREFPLAPPNS